MGQSAKEETKFTYSSLQEGQGSSEGDNEQLAHAAEVRDPLPTGRTRDTFMVASELSLE